MGVPMPTQVYFFTMPLNTYTLGVALAVMAGCAWTLWQVRHSWPAFSATLNAWCLCAFLSVIAGRAGYTLLHLDYFQEHGSEVISTASPGLWEHALLLGWLAGEWVARKLHQQAPPGSACVLLTLVGIGASVGCIPAGCAYGREVYWTDGWLWSLRADWPDATLINNPRLPTQLCMALWLGVCLFIVWLIWARRRHTAQRHWMLPSWIALFALGDFIIQYARADAMPMLGPLRISQWADLAFIACYMIGLWIRRTTTRPTRASVM